MRLPALLVAGLTAAPLVIAAPAHAVAAPKPAKDNDFNGDGERDFAVSSYVSPRSFDDKARGRVSVIYGGRHRVQTLTPQGLRLPGLPGLTGRVGLGEALVSADFDRDGFADLAITAHGYHKVIIVYGSRKGLSSRRALLPVDPAGNTTLAAGDFDGDRRPDLAMSSGPNHWLFTRIGRGSATRRVLLTRPGYLREPAAADFTGDGITDLVYAFRWMEEGPAPKSILFKGSKNGLGKPVEIDLVKVRSVSAGDVNGDGRADLVIIAPGEAPDGRLLLLKNHKGKITTKGLKVFTGKRLGAALFSWQSLP